MIVLRSLLIALILSTTFGCAGISVSKADPHGVLQAWKASLATPEAVSPRSLQTLRAWDLESIYHQSPREAANRLHELAIQDPQPAFLFALAEIHYFLAQRAEKNAAADASAHYFFCAGYAYHYLFDDPYREKDHEVDNRFDPRFRLACDLYNNALAKCIRAAQKVGSLDPRQPLQIPTSDGNSFTLSVEYHDLGWPPEELGTLRFCADYDVQGLSNHYRTYGLGVPLIGTRAATGHKSNSALYPRDVSFPVTAFFRFDCSLADMGTRRAGKLDLYNPLVTQSLMVRGTAVPLESDLTTPLAYFLANTDLQGIEYTGFLRVDALKDRTGIYMLEPYQPGKIPVLMVHGLLSSPLTWSPLFNDLRADPVLRQNFQFWFYLYPSGNPYLTTAADLRQRLTWLRTELDATRQDPALDHLVMIGHSMGGLVSKLLTINSDDDFWGLVSNKPFDQIKGKPEDRSQLEQVFFFPRQPFVERVIFIGTPHHGSKLSPAPLARFADRFVRTQQSFGMAVREIAAQNPDVRLGLRAEHLPSSVDLLAPGASALELLAARSPAQGVHYHSIIGDAPPDNLLKRVGYYLGEDARRSDGIVPYFSAHLDNVESEKVVSADHMQVHQHPLAVQEVRRILLQHLKECQAGSGVRHAFESN